jgi:transposase InsO family protein
MDVKKSEPVVDGIVSGGQTQQEINSSVEEVVSRYPAVFQGLGRAKVDPVNIEIDSSVKPIVQKQRRIALKYRQRFEDHLNELEAAGVVSRVGDSSEATGWVSNPVISTKSWDSTKIRVTLDTRHMAEAVKTSHFPIPTPTELRHEFRESDRFSQLDMNHSFHQFEMTDSSKELYKFWTHKGLYRFNTLVMGVSSGSSECHEKLRRILEGLEGVVQIKDDLVVHGKGEQHDRRLEALLARLAKYNITLRKEKCAFGQQEVKWFGNIYSKEGMSPDPDKVSAIKAWPRPEDKAAVKSFLQTVAFCQVFMRPADGRTYSDVTKPLRALTAKSVRFQWSKDCEASFKEMKGLLVSDKVMASFDPERKTRLYVDEGPTGVAATVAQQHRVEGMDHPVWRPVAYNSRAKTEAELGYGKVDGESLAVMSGMLSNKMYLYGMDCEVVTDHLPLVSMYNKHSMSLPVRVAKHKSKLRAFHYKVTYEPGVTTPADYGSRHHSALRPYSRQQREELGVEEEEEDMEIIVNRVEDLTDAVTLEVLKESAKKDPEVVRLTEDVMKGVRKTELSGYKDCYSELSVVDGLLVRGERLVIPRELRVAVLEAGHEGCPGRDSMLQQLRLDTWWPGQTKDVKDFVDTCDGCAASVDRNQPAPMAVRETPEAAWQHCSADFKGPIGGQFYFHVLIDNYSRWPEVEIVKSTSFEKLRPALEGSFSLHGIPESITHDNGPPYNSRAWRAYAKEKGFESRACTPEHPEGNGIAERFMGVLVKVVHTAIAQGRDPKEEVMRRLLNYRNTRHPSTGCTPAELLMNRRPRTKIPSLRRPAEGEVHRRAQAKDRETRAIRKEVVDKKKRAAKKEICPGDRILIKQQKTTIKPPYDPKPYTVTGVKAAQVTAERGAKSRVRDMSRVKLLKPRPEHLRRREARQASSDSDSDEDFLDLKVPVQVGQGEPAEEEQEPAVAELEDVVVEQEERQEGPDTPPGRRRTPRVRFSPVRFDPSHYDSSSSHKQPSPQQRKKRRSAAAKHQKAVRE